MGHITGRQNLSFGGNDVFDITALHSSNKVGENNIDNQMSRKTNFFPGKCNLLLII
jgi:hypothetical protein